MQQLCVHPNLLGSKIKNTANTMTLTIVACWMEPQPLLRPQFTVLGVGVDGQFSKVFLPDTDWEMEPSI